MNLWNSPALLTSFFFLNHEVLVFFAASEEAAISRYDERNSCINIPKQFFKWDEKWKKVAMLQLYHSSPSKCFDSFCFAIHKTISLLLKTPPQNGFFFVLWCLYFISSIRYSLSQLNKQPANPLQINPHTKLMNLVMNRGKSAEKIKCSEGGDERDW